MEVCFLCKSFKKDDIQYGEFLKNKDFGVHTFCLYLSSNLEQKGSDDEGFLGFLPNDIKAEVKRISLLKCCYCRKKYANIGCCEKKCPRSFHFICGTESGAENRFCRDFRSYCHKHALAVRERPSPTETCLICFDHLCAPGEIFNKTKMIMTPCCRNGWFHKLCLQKFAKTAGYFFKCPLCNDDKAFREKLPAKGIFIPNQDAAWELEPNAFAELLERPNKCAAERCKNKKGRNANSDHNPFVMCQTCGSIAIHKLCLSNGGNNFNCADCSVALEEHDSGRESLNSYVNQNDEYIDVCHVSDKEDLEIVNRLIATSGTRTENKRDSGTHHDTDISDEEQLHTTKKYRQMKNDDIKCCTSKRSTRLRIESESSGTSEEIKNSCTKTRFISETESSSSEEIVLDYTDDTDNDDNSDLENVNDSENSASTGQEKIKMSRKRKELFIIRDSDDEMPSPKQNCLINGNTGKEHIPHHTSQRLMNFTDESDQYSDDDPLEYFPKIIQKRKNGCTSKRNITLLTTDTEAENEKSDAEINKNRQCVERKEKSRASKEQRNSDKSCIALRTRPKSMERKKQTRNENLLNYSCIALRTRRKTICGLTDFNKQTEYEKSQGYTNYCETAETLEPLTDKNDRSETSADSDINNFIVDDGYEERDTKFENSCIANRTRRRQSLKKCQLLPKIDEISDCSSESSKSSESLCKVRNFRRLHNRRIYSSSSDEFNTPTSTLPKANALKLEKYPSRNSSLITNNKKTESSNSKHVFRYHPSNTHHPHNSNRNRI